MPFIEIYNSGNETAWDLSADKNVKTKEPSNLNGGIFFAIDSIGLRRKQWRGSSLNKASRQLTYQENVEAQQTGYWSLKTHASVPNDF